MEATFNKVEEFINQLDLSTNTKKTYSSILNMFFKEYTKKLTYNGIIKYYDTKYKLQTTKNTHISSLITYFKYASPNSTLIKSLHEYTKNQYAIILQNKQEKPIIEQPTEILNLDELKEKLAKFTGKLPDNYRFYFLINLNNPSLRFNDYLTLKIRNFDTAKDNYIDNGKIYFNNLVKSKNIKNITINLNNEEIKLLEKDKKEFPQDYLLHNRKFDTEEEKYFTIKRSNETVNRWCKKVFGFNTHTFRKLSYIDLTNNDKETLQKVLEICKKQNHSLDIAIDYYM